MGVVYFDQLLGAAHTLKLVETFFCRFSTFFDHFKAYLGMCTYQGLFWSMLYKSMNVVCAWYVSLNDWK